MRRTLTLATVLVLVAFAGQLSGATIGWTAWTPSPTSPITGSMNGITVTYNGDTFGTVFNYPSWTPSTTFADGVKVDNPPPPENGMIRLTGGAGAGTNKITFSMPVINPVMAIWSLGQSGIEAQFNFDQPFQIVSGGPSAEYFGVPITADCTQSPQVCGIEGNGTIQFQGTFSSISFTNPVYENYYGFTVGSPVPEPATLGFIGLGLIGIAVGAFRRGQ